MAVYDRWHRDPRPGDQPCKCGRGRNRLYPSAVHGKGSRWQVRWDDPESESRRQPRRNFDLRDPGPGELPDPNRHASAFDKEIQGSIVRNDYRDPNAGNISLRAYAEQYRRTRVHGESAAAGLEGRLRNHVYEGEPGSGRTPKGGVSIGQHPMGLLARRPSVVAAWMAAMPLGDSSRLLVLGDVSAVFQAAMEDGIVGRDPTKSKAVDRPGRRGGRAQPYAPAEVAGIAAHMRPRFALVPYLGAGTGMREMELAAFGADDIVRGRRPKVRVLRQLTAVAGELRWGPVKNRRPHDLPVPAALLERIDDHLERFPATAVTLPWHEPGSKLHGTPVTVRAVLSREDGRPLDRNAMDSLWRPAVAGLLARGAVGRRKGRSLARGYGIHRLRHTFASVQLRDGTDVVRVAAWMGDTVDVVVRTYAHLMPDDHDGEEAGRAASAAFLGACALDVPSGGGSAASGLVDAGLQHLTV
jgi:integrase